MQHNYLLVDEDDLLWECSLVLFSITCHSKLLPNNHVRDHS